MVKQRIDDRPNYYYGQLLTESDFLAEQEFHVKARESHNRHLHGAGIVYGLEVEASGDTAIKVSAGLAIDDRGREIRLREPAIVDLSRFSEKEVLTIDVHHEDEAPEKETNRRTSYAVVRVVTQGESVAAGFTLLAKVQLDEHAKVRSSGIDLSQRKSAGVVLAAGSVKAESLEERLREGWMKLPFRPSPLDKDPEATGEIPPMFRVGATETRSHSKIDGVENKRGAGGTMAIPIPPGVKRITHFRIAGAHNSDGIELRLVRGGWDPVNNEHVRKNLVGGEAGARIKPSEKNKVGRTPYNMLFDISEGALDPEYSTLSLWLRGSGRTAVSLVAVKFSY